MAVTESYSATSSHPVRRVATAFAIRLAIPRDFSTTVDQSSQPGTEPSVFVELERVEIVGPRQSKLAHQLLAYRPGVVRLRVETVHRRERGKDFTVGEPARDRRDIQEVARGVPLNDQPPLDAQDLSLRGNTDLLAGNGDFGRFERSDANPVGYRCEDAVKAAEDDDGALHPRRLPSGRRLQLGKHLVEPVGQTRHDGVGTD
jgi:hypothetical protein